MKKHIVDEKTGISYTLHGEYYLPDLELPDGEGIEIGVWGQRHLRYIREHRKGLYSQLVLTGALNNYLADVDRKAEGAFLRLVNEIAERESVTERLKAEDQMEWVRRMNCIREMAIEIVNKEIVFS